MYDEDERATANAALPLVKDLLKRETLDEQEVLQVTGLPPAPALESKRIAIATGERKTAGVRK